MSSWRDSASKECQSDLNALLNAAMVAGYTGIERPLTTEVLEILYEGLRSRAEEKRGAAVVSDVRLRGEGSDAIQVEHGEGTALKLLLPYRKKRSGGKVETGEMRGEAGERRIWLR